LDFISPQLELSYSRAITTNGDENATKEEHLYTVGANAN
jgi:hypothetical protein